LLGWDAKGKAAIQDYCGDFLHIIELQAQGSGRAVKMMFRPQLCPTKGFPAFLGD